MMSRAGYVALVGLPNAGKSTLLNGFLDQTLCIVTPKAQTTWKKVIGIRTSDEVQAIFVDTPGLLRADNLLHESMVRESQEAIREADLVLLAVDGTDPPDKEERLMVKENLALSKAPLEVLINKIDSASPANISRITSWATSELQANPFGVSGLHGDGLEKVWKKIVDTLPESPFLYPKDDIGSAPVRFFVAEFIRETIFDQYSQEVPYAVHVSIDEFREGQDPIYVKANLIVERDSQKMIVLGKRGRSIKKLGELARSKIENFLERRIYLDLWVKVLPNWRRRKKDLERLGFHLPKAERK
tara:strand:+ start:213 stop:1115 length:903 start_codon:yes stop_codon:yes gene_type:complete